MVLHLGNYEVYVIGRKFKALIYCTVFIPCNGAPIGISVVDKYDKMLYILVKSIEREVKVNEKNAHD